MRAALVALMLVTAVAAAGCGAAKHVTVTTTVTATTTTTVAPTTTSAKTVPANFQPTSFTAVSDDDFWLLGKGVIARTTNGGSSFNTIAAPTLPSTGVTPQLRFADHDDGYAFVTWAGGAFYSTHDGGATWHKVAFPGVIAFATSDGYAYAVTATCGPKGCTDYHFERSPVSTDDWTTAAMPFAANGSPVSLTAHGPNVWLAGTSLARSTDDGKTFTTGASPCVAGLGGDLEPTSEQVVWAVCPTGMEAGAWRSTDGGATFETLKTPELVNSAQIAPASDDTAVLAQGANGTLQRTTDTGATWTDAQTPAGATDILFVGFTDANVGAALAQTNRGTELWRTTDGGATWTVVQF